MACRLPGFAWCDAEAGPAAAEVTAYWAQIVAETAVRQDLAAFVVDYLSGKATAMSNARTTLGIRYAARSDRGLVRERNEDCAYAGARLLAVADGLGAHGGGDRASAAAINALKPLENDTDAADVLASLGQAVRRAGDDLRAIVESEPSMEGARHDPHRLALVRLPARAGPHWRLTCLPPA